MTAWDIAARQNGKTTRMIRWLKDAPEGVARVLICPTNDRAMQLLREEGYPAGLESWQFVSIGEVMDRTSDWMAGVYRWTRTIEYGVDDLDLVLPQILRLPVSRVSATEEEPC